LDHLTSVRDPRNLVTGYSVDGLDNAKQTVSPDTGSTSNTYDAAGNLKTATDARGKVSTYSYDALNRLTGITFKTPPRPSPSATTPP
jgi:YD repeat-containing protein